jgi:hypothetical protein
MCRTRVLALVILFFACATCLHAEYVFLKDGSIHQGKITSDPGAAVTVSASVSNFWINYLYVGLDVGYARMNCKMDNSYALNMVPVAAAAAYQFEISPLFSLTPKRVFY